MVVRDASWPRQCCASFLPPSPVLFVRRNRTWMTRIGRTPTDRIRANPPDPPPPLSIFPAPVLPTNLVTGHGFFYTSLNLDSPPFSVQETFLKGTIHVAARRRLH